MNAQLIGRIRRGVTETFNIRGEEVVLGREPGKGIAIPAEGVSRNHARIVWDGKSHWIEDLKSTNGTFLNGNPVSRERLRHLDVVTLGKKVDLVFVIREGAAPARRTVIVRAAIIPEEPDSAPFEVPVGETTLGRSSAANVIAESGAVSKLHARIERAGDQLVIHDLGSSNGTFVNGSRVSVSSLQHGDVVSLAGVVSYRVEVERGEVMGSGSHKLPAPAPAAAPPAAKDAHRYSEEWKTRLDWSSGERELIAEFRQKLAAEGEGAPTAKNPVIPGPKAGAAAADRTMPPVRPQPAGGKPAAPAVAGAAPRPAVAAAPTPAPAAAPNRPASAAPIAPAAAAPTVPAAAAPTPTATKPAAPAPAKPVVPAPEKPAAAPVAAAPPMPPKAAPTAPPVARTPTPTPAAPAAPKLPPPGADLEETAVRPRALATRIREVRLTGRDTALSVTAPGAYDIGRSREVPLRVTDATVSRRHARIILAEDRAKAFVEHLGGANGTRLNGAMVTSPQLLSDGDQMEVGELQLKVDVVRG